MFATENKTLYFCSLEKTEIPFSVLYRKQSPCFTQFWQVLFTGKNKETKYYNLKLRTNSLHQETFKQISPS